MLTNTQTDTVKFFLYIFMVNSLLAVDGHLPEEHTLQRGFFGVVKKTYQWVKSLLSPAPTTTEDKTPINPRTTHTGTLLSVCDAHGQTCTFRVGDRVWYEPKK